MKEKKQNKLVKFYILAVIILLIFLHYVGVLSRAEGVTLDFLSNNQNGTYAFFTKLKYSFINFQEAQNLKKENEDLKRAFNELTYEKSQLDSFKQENDKLKSLLNFFEETQYNYSVAKVISKDVSKENTLIINKGKNDGINNGYPVIIDKGIIIGKVIEAGDKISTVLLITDKQSELAISMENSSKTAGLAKGEYGLSIKAEYIPQDQELKENDLIITSGLEKDIPRGLIIGKVNRIISHENDLFKSAIISPLSDYQEITIVSVIIPK